MDQAQHLEWERRIARPAAAAAFAAVAMQVAAQVIVGLAFRDRAEGERGGLLALDQHASELAASTAVRALALALVAATLYYLYRCASHRRDLPPYFLPLLIAAPVFLAAAAVVTQIQAIDIASEFTESGARSEKRAENLLEDRSPVAAAIGLAGQLSLAFSYIVISLNAMRAGLLSRFMGILGIIVGVLYVLPLLGGQPVVEVFWLGALGFLFLGLWPRGRGPAWESGKEEPWPSSQSGLLAPAPREEEPDLPAEDDRPAPRKRKRKRKS